MNQKHYTKTAAGHAEIQQRAQPLSRAARNLLLLINESHSAEHWLTQIRGVTGPDLEHLVTLGLIAPVSPSNLSPATRSATPKTPPPAAPAASPPAAHDPAAGTRPAQGAHAAAVPSVLDGSGDTVPSAFADDDGEDSAAAAWRDLQTAIRTSEYTPLYDALTRHAKSQLGLVKGYKFTLQVEQCADLDSLRDLARQFSNTLRNERGMAAVEKFRSSLIDAREPR